MPIKEICDDATIDFDDNCVEVLTAKKGSITLRFFDDKEVPSFFID